MSDFDMHTTVQVRTVDNSPVDEDAVREIVDRFVDADMYSDLHTPWDSTGDGRLVQQGWSSWMLEVDWEELSRALGPGHLLTVDEEFYGDYPDHTSTTWQDGVLNPVASLVSRLVPQALQDKLEEAAAWLEETEAESMVGVGLLVELVDLLQV